MASNFERFRCANCDIEMDDARYVREGKPYCCLGCSLGGPCTCPDDELDLLEVNVNTDELEGVFGSLADEFAALGDDFGSTGDLDAPAPTVIPPAVATAPPTIDRSKVPPIIAEFPDEPSFVGILDPYDPDFAAAKVPVEVAVRPLPGRERAEEFARRLETVGLAGTKLKSFDDDVAIYEATAHDPSDAIAFLVGADSLGASALRVHGSRIEIELRQATKTRRTSTGGAVSYELGTDLFFNARHFVVTNGVRGPVHPHSWKVRITLQQHDLDENGMVVGFGEIKNIAQSVVSRFDNKILNSLPAFEDVLPTTENVASVMYQKLLDAFGGMFVRLRSVCVWETPTNYVLYSEED